MKGHPGPAVAAAAVLLLIAGGALVHASGQPPPPPGTPVCTYCAGPPPPPTPVPTLAPTAVPQPVVVAVKLSPVHVRRGHAVKLTVTASSGDQVTALVQYGHAKPVTFHGKVDSSGAYSKTWKVPKTAPLGKATLKVSVKNSVTPYTGTVYFVVTR